MESGKSRYQDMETVARATLPTMTIANSGRSKRHLNGLRAKTAGGRSALILARTTVSAFIVGSPQADCRSTQIGDIPLTSAGSSGPFGSNHPRSARSLPSVTIASMGRSVKRASAVRGEQDDLGCL